MPRKGQIIPSYTVPHVQTYINDNSIYENITATPSDGTRLLCVFASEKGEDHKVKEITSVYDYIEEYGEPNMKLYGQAGYMPYAALQSGSAKCYCMRIMPESAKYSNVVVLAKVKVEENPDDNTKKDLVIKFEARILTDLTDLSRFELSADILTDKNPDADGFETLPIVAVAVKGRGSYGNTYRFRMNSDNISDRDNEYKNYLFELLDVKSGITKSEQFRGSIDSTAIVGRTSLYLEDVISHPDNGSKKVKTLFLDANLEYIYSLYATQVAPSLKIEPMPFKEFDPILCRTKDDKSIEGVRLITEGQFLVTFDRPDGIMLSGGDDDLFSNMRTYDERTAAIDGEYMKAFKGEGGYDKSLRSKRRTPAELILDANYSDEVKKQLISLVNHRGDAMCYLDAGVLNNTSEILSWADDFYNLGAFNIAKECQHYKINDPFSGKIITVTMTYFLAGNLPRHFALNGNQTPFYGSLMAKLTGHIKDSVKPIIDADDLELKDKIYLKKVNFFECIAENVHTRATQGTSQLKSSDLSEANNVHVLLQMKRELEDFVASKIYNFAEKEDRIKFTESANALFDDYKGNKVRTYEVYFDANKFEEERNILHCYLSVVFKGMAKIGIIEIDINKRTSGS